MKVELAYGRDGLVVELPDGRCDVVEPHYPPPLADPVGALRRALAQPIDRPPLRSVVRSGQRVVVSVCDGTRAQPRPLVMRALLAELDGVIDPTDVTILVATGTHRANTDQELVEMLGPEVLAACPVVNHDARDPSGLVHLGTAGAGVPVWLNRHWAEAEVRISTGFVEPHFFAGFSGGPKMVVPGLAGLETVMVLHDARRIGDARATWGVCEGNPVHDDIRAAAALAPPTLACDVLLDRQQRITRVFAGELSAMHAAARAAARRDAMYRLARQYPVVVTTNSGFPLDQNLYQAVKGMAAAEAAVADGGLIVTAAQCADGLPDHGSYAELLHRADSPAGLAGLFDDPDLSVPDQWQVQVQARILARARVGLYCEGLDASQVRAAHLEPVGDVAEAVRRALAAAGSDGRVCVLPDGPQTIPYMAG